MITHQAKRVQSALEAGQRSFKVKQVKAAISVIPKARGAVIAALDNMQRKSINDESRASGHAD